MSLFGDLFSLAPAPTSSPMRQLPTVVSQQQHNRQNFRDRVFPMEMLRVSKILFWTTSRRRLQIEKELRNAKRKETPVEKLLGNTWTCRSRSIH